MVWTFLWNIPSDIVKSTSSCMQRMPCLDHAMVHIDPVIHAQHAKTWHDKYCTEEHLLLKWKNTMDTSVIIVLLRCKISLHWRSPLMQSNNKKAIFPSWFSLQACQLIKGKRPICLKHSVDLKILIWIQRVIAIDHARSQDIAWYSH